MLNSNETANIKIVVIGDNSVGKASVISKFFGTPISNPSGQRINLGMEFMIQETEMGGKVYKFHIYVTEGGESVSLLRRRHFGGANAFLIIYDVSNLRSFENIISYLQEVIEGVEVITPLLYIVANKIDLRSTIENCITREEAESNFSQIITNNLLDLSYVEVSCVTGENFDKFISSFHKSIVFGRDLKLI